MIPVGGGLAVAGSIVLFVVGIAKRSLFMAAVAALTAYLSWRAIQGGKVRGVTIMAFSWAFYAFALLSAQFGTAWDRFSPLEVWPPVRVQLMAVGAVIIGTMILRGAHSKKEEQSEIDAAVYDTGQT